MASILWLPVVFACCSGLLYWLSMSLPALPAEGLSVNSTALKFPSNLQELQALATLLEHYRSNHMTYVVTLYSTAYLFKQAFAIPGSIFLNLLGGALFGQWIGFVLTCLLSASGATCCFILAKVCGRSYIVKYFPDKLSLIQSKIEQNSDSLFFFLMFLRLFPMTPNWFLNMASPICGVPTHLFFLSVFFGLMPYNFITVQTGCLLSQLTTMDKIFTPWTMVKLFTMAAAALVPGLCIKSYQEYRSNKQKQETETQKKLAVKSPENIGLLSAKVRQRVVVQPRSKSADRAKDVKYEYPTWHVRKPQPAEPPEQIIDENLYAENLKIQETISEDVYVENLGIKDTQDEGNIELERNKDNAQIEDVTAEPVKPKVERDKRKPKEQIYRPNWGGDLKSHAQPDILQETKIPEDIVQKDEIDAKLQQCETITETKTLAENKLEETKEDIGEVSKLGTVAETTPSQELKDDLTKLSDLESEAHSLLPKKKEVFDEPSDLMNQLVEDKVKEEQVTGASDNLDTGLETVKNADDKITDLKHPEDAEVKTKHMKQSSADELDKRDISEVDDVDGKFSEIHREKSPPKEEDSPADATSVNKVSVVDSGKEEISQSSEVYGEKSPPKEEDSPGDVTIVDKVSELDSGIEKNFEVHEEKSPPNEEDSPSDTTIDDKVSKGITGNEEISQISQTKNQEVLSATKDVVSPTKDDLSDDKGSDNKSSSQGSTADDFEILDHDDFLSSKDSEEEKFGESSEKTEEAKQVLIEEAICDEQPKIITHDEAQRKPDQMLEACEAKAQELIKEEDTISSDDKTDQMETPEAKARVLIEEMEKVSSDDRTDQKEAPDAKAQEIKDEKERVSSDQTTDKTGEASLEKPGKVKVEKDSISCDDKMDKPVEVCEAKAQEVMEQKDNVSTENTLENKQIEDQEGAIANTADATVSESTTEQDPQTSGTSAYKEKSQ